MKNLVCMLTFAVACVPPQSPPPAEPQAEAAQPAGKNCIQVVECLAGCGQDQACIPACMDSGDPAAQAAVTALLECNAASGGACEAELEACRGTGEAVATAPAPTPAAPAAQPTDDPRQPHTTANILPWLVGQWITPNHQFTFWDNGTVRRASGVGLTNKTGDYKCVSTINETGTVTQEGDLLIMVFPVADGNTCGTKESMAGLTVRYRIDWFENPYGDDPSKLDLRLIDIDCTRGEMFCYDRMRRR